MKRGILSALLALVILVALVGYHTRHGSKDPRVLYYVDPMHPAYRANKPGIAPDCGMRLVPVYASESGMPQPSRGASSPATLSVDAATRKRYGIRVVKVEMSSGEESMRAFGRVVAEDTRVYRVNIGSPGFVKETEDDAIGTHVRSGQRLAVVYSSEVLYAAAGFISGNERVPGATMLHDASPASQAKPSVASQADYLRNLGMDETQIKELSETHKLPQGVYVVSPTDGFILSRSISPGLRFEKGADFYTIADLRHVWVVAELFGRDARSFRPGTIARIVLPDSGITLRGRVADVLPEVDPSTRALKVRLEVDNPNFVLRPDMYVNVELPVALASGPTVPTDALFDTGLIKRVFVETSEGQFEPREVETGWRVDDRVQIVKGLREGETVVSSGTFLIDSESQLRAGGTPGQMPAEHRAD